MAERLCAEIRIGGRLARAQVPALLQAIRASGGARQWGETAFLPASLDDLHTARCEGQLVLRDDQASTGMFAELETACQQLGLAYTRWSAGQGEYDPELVHWHPGLFAPVVRHSSNAQPHETFVASTRVRRALTCLERGRERRALVILRGLCPQIPDLPVLEIVP